MMFGHHRLDSHGEHSAAENQQEHDAADHYGAHHSESVNRTSRHIKGELRKEGAAIDRLICRLSVNQPELSSTPLMGFQNSCSRGVPVGAHSGGLSATQFKSVV